jgi:nucleoside 2-deoxyribosyltransferase
MRPNWIGKVYLIGPITGLSYKECTDWREYARKVLAKRRILGISPLRGKPYLRGKRKILPAYPMPLSTAKGITTRARFDVRRCDLLLANLLEAEEISRGTLIEYGWADALGKPIITVMEKEGNPHDHPVVRELSGYVVNTLESGLAIAIAHFES